MLTALIAYALIGAPTTLAIRDVSVIHPGKSKAEAHMTVIVTGEQIVSVKRTSPNDSPKGAQVINGAGEFLMPGLWDMHVHLMDAKSLPLFTANGVTGVRAMFGDASQLGWKKQIESRKIVGPQMVLGSKIVDGPKPIWQGSIAVGTPEQGRAAVRKIKADGYDFVKVYSLLSRESYHAIADECKRIGLPFAGHVPNSVGLLEAAKAGQRSSEHMMGLAIASSFQEEEIRDQIAALSPEGMAKSGEMSRKLAPQIKETYDPKKWDLLVKGLRDGGMWQVPTLIVLKAISYLDVPEFRKDDRLKYLPAFLTISWDPKTDFRLKSRTEADWATAKKTFEQNMKWLGLLHKAHVPILAGTDCLNPFVFPGFSLHDELAMLVEAGMTPTEALTAATTSPARFLGIEKKQGDIVPGMRANLVLLTANPLDDIRNTKKIDKVIQRGEVFHRARLDSLLKACEYPPFKPSGASLPTGFHCEH